MKIFNEKSANAFENHGDVHRLLEQIEYQHETASKLEKELQHEKTVLEERLKSTERMLIQIGQDMVMAEQQIRAHKSQTRRTVQLKRLLPEYQLMEEKNLYKCLAIATDARKLIETIDMKSLQELRAITKPEQGVEDTLAAVIMICKFDENEREVKDAFDCSEISDSRCNMAKRCEETNGESRSIYGRNSIIR